MKRIRVVGLLVLFCILLNSNIYARYTMVGVSAVQDKVSKKYKGKVVIFVGDSRTMHQSSVNTKGSVYAWVNGGGVGVISRGGLKSKLVKLLKKYNNRCIVVFNLGVNGNSSPKKNARRLINTYNKYIKKYKNIDFYVESINPTAKSRTSYRNSNVKAVNKILKKKFKDRFIDTYSYLVDNKIVNTKTGKGTRDRLHYKNSVSRKIEKYVKNIVLSKGA